MKLRWTPASQVFRTEDDLDEIDLIYTSILVSDKFGENDRIGRFAVSQEFSAEGIIYQLTYNRHCQRKEIWDEYKLFQWYFLSISEAIKFAELNTQAFTEIDTEEDEVKKLLDNILPSSNEQEQVEEEI